jgi:hypothetical protein
MPHLPLGRPLALGGLVLACALAGCGGSHDYPAAAKHGFLTSCERNAPAKVCSCTLAKLQKKMSYDDLKKENASIAAGNKPSRTLTDAVAECTS